MINLRNMHKKKINIMYYVRKKNVYCFYIIFIYKTINYKDKR